MAKTLPASIVYDPSGKLVTQEITVETSGPGSIDPSDLTLANGSIIVGDGSNLGSPVSKSAAVTSSLLTGYVSGAGVVAASDTLLVGINKLNGNTAAVSTIANAALPSASFTDASVSSKLITGYVSGAGVVAASDTILQAVNKLNGNDALKLPLTGGTVTGTIVMTGVTNTLRPPVLTDTDMNALTPAEGMVIYNVTSHSLAFYDGTVWKVVATV